MGQLQISCCFSSGILKCYLPSKKEYFKSVCLFLLFRKAKILIKISVVYSIFKAPYTAVSCELCANQYNNIFL